MKYFVAFIVIAVVGCIVADIAFQYEMKKYKEELERRGKNEKGNTAIDSGSNG